MCASAEAGAPTMATPTAKSIWRTMLITQDKVHIPVGGGIVAESDPAAEYEETLVKARAMFAALGVSPDDLG